MHLIPQKNWLSALSFLMVFCFATAALAEEAPVGSPPTPPAPKAAIMIFNHAEITQYKGEDFHAKLTNQLIQATIAALPENYKFVDTHSCAYLLKKAGIDDPLIADKERVAQALQELDLDQLVLVVLEPFYHHNRQALFNFKVETTGTLRVQVIGIKSSTLLSEQVFTETATKDNPISYNQVIPLVMDKLLTDLKQAVQDGFSRDITVIGGADGPTAIFTAGQ